MGLIQDVGGKLVQNFLSLDDLVLGQGLISESRSQIELTGRSLASSLAVGSNVAVRAVHVGIQAGAKTARATASALDGFVPGARLAVSLAERVDEQAAAAGEEASKIANYAVELSHRKVPRNPLTNDEWLSKSVPFGYGWNDLAADTTLGSVGRLATLPLTLGRDAAMMVSSTVAGREVIATSLKSLGVLLNLVPGSSATELDTDELREALMAVTTSSGSSAVRNLQTLTEAAARFAFGDTRKLREGIEEALDQMRLLAAHTELGELMPSVPISATLKKRAQRIVDNAPARFLKALEPSPEGEAPRPGAVLSALLKDARQLQILAAEYPTILALMGTNINLFLTAGMFDVSKIESYLQAENAAAASRPWSAAQLEAFVGRAPDSPFLEATVKVAQDTVFTYTNEVLGRKKALARMANLYGEDARDRCEADVSLDVEIRRLSGAKQNARMRQQISDLESTEELTWRQDICQNQLESLRAFTNSLYGYQPKEIAERESMLATYVSLINQDLALRGSATPHHSERMEALSHFEEWADAS